tara:strand:+ start:572 stop:928 length:357 start_codon:yes stop_codon:yes gene_type:complete
MIMRIGMLVILAQGTSISLAQSSNAVPWDFESVPITVEVAQDVPIKRCGFELGVLCANAEFVIPRGDRFQMLEVGLEGGCIIEYLESRYEVNSCPWLHGFRDPQAEVFVVVEVPRNDG